MPNKRKAKAVWVAMLALALGLTAFAGSASAKLTGEFARFAQCPYTNLEVRRCVHSTTTGGKVVLGNKTVPILNPTVLQGGYGIAGEDEFSKFFAAKNGETLSKAGQNVPGGLAGFVNCTEISNFLLRVSCEAVFENGLTGVTSTLELANGAAGIRISESHLAEEFGTALEMQIKIKLDNPFLGSNCYVGSAAKPVIWKLTSGTTPDGKMKGTSGLLELFEEGSVLKLKDAELVDNSWAAPAASGCGGIFSFIIDPIVNSSSGLPAAAGKNVAVLKNQIYQSPRAAVNLNNVDNP